jgi:asparagine synthase (glutamine-hydrolysing)
MNNSRGNSVNGVFGSLDQENRFQNEVSDWANAGGASLQLQVGALQVFIIGDVPTFTRTFIKDGIYGVFLGEIYETAPSLHKLSDAYERRNQFEEIFVDSYRSYGADIVRDIVGQYALFLWDEKEQSLLLYRDDSSTHNIYYQEDSTGRVTFSNKLDLLIEMPGVYKCLSRKSLHEYLRFLDISTPNTIYDKVYSTEPGILHRWRNKRSDNINVFEHTENSGEVCSVDEAVVQLDKVLEKSVAARIRTEEKAVVFLSGGVDSSLLCAIAAGIGEAQIEAVTVGFKEKEYDESSVARRVAEYLNVSHHVMSYTMAEYYEAFKELTSNIEYPFADPAELPTLLAFKESFGIAQVALDGTGADTLIGIMPSRYHRYATQYLSLIPRVIRRLAVKSTAAIPPLSRYTAVLDFDDPEELLIRWRGWTRREIEALCNESVSLGHTRFYRIFRSFPRREHFKRYSALMGNLPDDRIHQASLLTGLKVRFPFFDPAVADCVRNMNPDALYQSGQSKLVLKKILANRVPRELWDVPKHGFDFPFVKFLEANDYAIINEYLSKEKVSMWNLFDERLVAECVNGFIRGEREQSFKVWGLLVLFAWLENHYK